MKTHEHRPQQLKEQPASAGTLGKKGHSCVINSREPVWAVQAGLLTPLTFTRHRLRPLADFTSGAYFLHNGKQ